MLSRVGLNLTLVATVLMSYAAIASELNGEQYCLGGAAATQALPFGSQRMFCSTLDIDTPQPPDLHWRALLPG